jgi:hypothetical protein
MVEYTDEQKAEIAALLEQQRKNEQYRIAADFGYRASILYLRQNYDPFVAAVMENESNIAKARLFPQAAPDKKEGAEGADSEE